jgi:hypothetical protein
MQKLNFHKGLFFILISWAIVLSLGGCIQTNKPHTHSIINNFCNIYKPIDYKNLQGWENRLVERNKNDLQSVNGFILGFEKDYKHDELYRTKEWLEMKVKLTKHFDNYELYMLLSALNNNIYLELSYYNNVYNQICKKQTSKKSLILL